MRREDDPGPLVVDLRHHLLDRRGREGRGGRIANASGHHHQFVGGDRAHLEKPLRITIARLSVASCRATASIA